MKESFSIVHSSFILNVKCSDCLHRPCVYFGSQLFPAGQVMYSQLVFADKKKWLPAVLFFRASTVWTVKPPKTMSLKAANSCGVAAGPLRLFMPPCTWSPPVRETVHWGKPRSPPSTLLDKSNNWETKFVPTPCFWCRGSVVPQSDVRSVASCRSPLIPERSRLLSGEKVKVVKIAASIDVMLSSELQRKRHNRCLDVFQHETSRDDCTVLNHWMRSQFRTWEINSVCYETFAWLSSVTKPPPPTHTHTHTHTLMLDVHVCQC